jgi:hypothetical protein
MAAIKGDGVRQIVLANGVEIPVDPDYEHLSLDGAPGCYGVLVEYPDGGCLWVAAYDNQVIDGLQSELEDGSTFTAEDGCTFTRQGDEMVATKPRDAELPVPAKNLIHDELG